MKKSILVWNIEIAHEYESIQAYFHMIDDKLNIGNVKNKTTL
jgi:hypothetical protein